MKIYYLLKIETFEGEIDSLIKENSDINSKIKILKDNNLENAKKIEGLKDNKKFNNKMKSENLILLSLYFNIWKIIIYQ